MASYRFHVQKISGFFECCEFKHIPRGENEAADVLFKLGSSRDAIPPGIALEHLRKPSILPSPESESIFLPKESGSEAVPMKVEVGNTSLNPGTAALKSGTRHGVHTEVMSAETMDIDAPVFPVRHVPGWAQPIMAYISNDTLTENEVEAR